MIEWFMRGIGWPQAFVLAVLLVCITAALIDRWPFQKD